MLVFVGAGPPAVVMTGVSNQLAPEHEVLLRDLLRATIGSRVEVVDYRIANQQPDYFVLLIELRQPQLDLVVKLAGPHAVFVHSFESAALLNRLVATHTAIPMPEVLAVDEGCMTWPWRYLIRTHIAGQEWAVVRRMLDRDELRAAYHELGSAVAQLHAIHFPAFGEVAADGVIAAADAHEALTAHARNIIQQQEHLHVFVRVIQQCAHLFAGLENVCLCHDDLHQHNILFSRQEGRWRLATVLDFDKAWAGHAESDLARLELWHGMTSDGFWDAYTESHSISPEYKQRRPIYQLLWCLEYAVASLQHNADTARICHELGIPPVQFI